MITKIGSIGRIHVRDKGATPPVPAHLVATLLDLLVDSTDEVLPRLVQFQLNDPEPLLYHNEPIYRQGKIIGYITSGMYGHHLGGAIGLGYISDDIGIDEKYINESQIEVLVAGKMEPAKGSLYPLYDPKSKRIRD